MSPQYVEGKRTSFNYSLSEMYSIYIHIYIFVMGWPKICMSLPTHFLTQSQHLGNDNYCMDISVVKSMLRFHLGNDVVLISVHLHDESIPGLPSEKLLLSISLLTRIYKTAQNPRVDHLPNSISHQGDVCAVPQGFHAMPRQAFNTQPGHVHYVQNMWSAFSSKLLRYQQSAQLTLSHTMGPVQARQQEASLAHIHNQRRSSKKIKQKLKTYAGKN